MRESLVSRLSPRRRSPRARPPLARRELAFPSSAHLGICSLRSLLTVPSRVQHLDLACCHQPRYDDRSRRGLPVSRPSSSSMCELYSDTDIPSDLGTAPACVPQRLMRYLGCTTDYTVATGRLISRPSTSISERRMISRRSLRPFTMPACTSWSVELTPRVILTLCSSADRVLLSVCLPV
jgi:hypothetical protein